MDKKKPKGMLSTGRMLFLAAVLIAGGCSSIPRVVVMPRVGILAINGDLDLGSGNGRLKATSNARKLGLEKEVALQPRFSLDWDKLHISLAAAGVEYTAGGRARASFTLGPLHAGGDIPVRSDLEAGYIATEVIYDIPPIHFIDLGIGFGIGGASYDVAFSEKILRTRLSADDTTIFGYVAGRVDKDIGRFRLLLHLSGLALEPRDWELHFRDIDFNASYRLFGSHDGTVARVLLGYRYLSIDYKFRDEDIRIKTDATLSGPLFGFVLSF